jgi:transcriptional regulator with XRE-family HTH domain
MLGLSTREVAARTDGVITYAGLSRIEIGARYPRLRTLEALCEVLGITIEINSKGTRVKW